MSISEAVHQGLATHPGVRAAMADVDRADVEVDVAKGGYFPSVDMKGGPSTASSDPLTYNITVSQMVYDWGRVESKVDSASATLRKQAENLLVVRESAALEIVETYLDVLAGNLRLQAAEEYLERLMHLRNLTDTRQAGGYSDASEKARTELAVGKGKEQLALEKGKLRDAEAQYQIQVGQDPVNLVLPPFEPWDKLMPTDELELNELIAQSPLYRKAGEDVAVAEAGLQGAKAALLPQLRLEGMAIRRPVGGQMRSDEIASLSFSMDPFQGLSNFKRADAEAQRVQSAQGTLDSVLRESRRKIRSWFETADALKWRLEAFEGQLSKAAEVRALYEEQFQVGKRSIVDLLNVENESFEAQRQRAAAIIEWQRLQYRAVAQLGQLVPLLEGRLTNENTP
ncbi:MAG: TolC family protein [Gammaproteobacteria bacterium]